MIRAVNTVDQEAGEGLRKSHIKSSAPLMNDPTQVEQRD